MELPAAIIDIDTGTALVLITAIALPIAAIAFARSGTAWRSIGKGPLAIEQDLSPRAPADDGPADRALQIAEARQMLEAKSYRREQRGKPPLDVEAEIRRLLDPSTTEGPSSAAGSDTELRSEVRRLVVAQNERRLRRGQKALDVEKETERQLADLVGSD